MVVFVTALAVLLLLTVGLFGILWLVERRRLARDVEPREPAAPAAKISPPPPRPLTAADARAIYAHFLATLGWALFWFSAIGGTAAVLIANSTDNRLDYPLVIVGTVTWGCIGAALAVGTRAELRKLRR